MANVIGRTQGYTRNGPKAGEATRLGSEYVRSEANTWRTFVRVETSKDGRVQVRVERGGEKLYLDIVAEDHPLNCNLSRTLAKGASSTLYSEIPNHA